jgi:hypothetical protein
MLCGHSGFTFALRLQCLQLWALNSQDTGLLCPLCRQPAEAVLRDCDSYSYHRSSVEHFIATPCAGDGAGDDDDARGAKEQWKAGSLFRRRMYAAGGTCVRDACNELLARQARAPASRQQSGSTSQALVDFFCASQGHRVAVRHGLDGNVSLWVQRELQATLHVDDPACCHEVRTLFQSEPPR